MPQHAPLNGAYLTIRFDGPAVQASRMRLDDFVQAASTFSTCAKRVALALQHTPSNAEGRPSRVLAESLSLDIVAFTEGSPAAVAHLERSQLTPPLLTELDLGEAAYSKLLAGLEALARPDHPLPEGFDLGVLLKVRDLGKLLGKGLTSISFHLNHRDKPLHVVYDLAKYERVRQRIAKPDAQLKTVEGRLLMVDYKESGRTIRIHPAVGEPVVCKFSDQLSAEVAELLRAQVRATGSMVYSESGDPKWMNLSDIEPIDVPEDFWNSLSAEEYSAQQGTEPIHDLGLLAIPDDPDDWTGFDEELTRWRA